MKNSRLTIMICFWVLLFGISAHSQTKKWTLEECIYYALEHNITIKNTALDGEIADIDKIKIKIQKFKYKLNLYTFIKKVIYINIE